MNVGNAKIALRMPAEHGAWGILLVPLACAASLAGRWSVPLLLSALCVLSLFLLRGSLEAQAGATPWRILLHPAHLALAAAAGAAAALLLLLYRRDQLLGVGIVALSLYFVQRWLVRTHQPQRTEKRSLLAEMVGAALLTLSAPAAWIASRGTLDRAGLALWLLNLLFFLGGILYVKYRVRGLLAHRRFDRLGERLAFAWPVFLYHSLLLMFLLCWVVAGLQPAATLLAFLPGTLRAHRLLFELGRRFAIPRLGWNEVFHSLLFAGLLIFALRAAA